MTDVGTPLFLGEEPFASISEAPFLGWYLAYDPVADFPTAVHTALDIMDWAGIPFGESIVPHTKVHQKVENELYATQDKIGSGASTPTLGKVLTGTGTGTSEWAAGPVMDTAFGKTDSADNDEYHGTAVLSWTGSHSTPPSIAVPFVVRSPYWILYLEMDNALSATTCSIDWVTVSGEVIASEADLGALGVWL